MDFSQPFRRMYLLASGGDSDHEIKGPVLLKSPSTVAAALIKGIVRVDLLTFKKLCNEDYPAVQ